MYNFSLLFAVNASNIIKIIMHQCSCCDISLASYSLSVNEFQC